MAKVLTVDELYAELAKARKAGLGKKKIMLSSDDEGNEYHPMYFAVTKITDEFEGTWFRDVESFKEAKENYVIVG